MYGVADPSTGAKIFLTAGHAVILAALGWLLLDAGIAELVLWTGLAITPGDRLRRVVLFACAAIYFARLFVTCFVFIKRKMSWREALQIVVWLAFVETTLSLAGGTHTASLDILDAAGIVLYAAGSTLNTGAEWFRLRWRARPGNAKRLCVDGPFRHSMHPNYLGDVILFAGWAALAGRWPAMLIPASMLALFLTINIPALDRHLASRHGADFERWSARTWRLIPLIY